MRVIAYVFRLSAYECIQLHVVCIWMHTAACEMHVSCMWAACGMHIRCVSVAYDCICKIRKWHAESFVYVQNILHATACTSVSVSSICLWAVCELLICCLWIAYKLQTVTNVNKGYSFTHALAYAITIHQCVTGVLNTNEKRLACKWMHMALC